MRSRDWSDQPIRPEDLRPALNEWAARAAGWVPLAEVLEALHDHDGFRAWALATDRAGYLDEYTPNDDVIGDFLAERFQPTADIA